MKATLYQGSSFTDNRGTIRFVTEEVQGDYKRFYLITHIDTNAIRAWQGHRHEEKAFYAISGRFTIAVVSPDCFDRPADDEKPDFFQLTAENNFLLRVPGGCYTGIKALTSHSTLLVLSGFDLAHSKSDDYRQPSDRWVDWSSIR